MLVQLPVKVALKDLNIKVYGPYDSLEHRLMLSLCPLAKKYMEESRSNNWSLTPLLRTMPNLTASASEDRKLSGAMRQN